MVPVALKDACRGCKKYHLNSKAGLAPPPCDQMHGAAPNETGGGGATRWGQKERPGLFGVAAGVARRGSLPKGVRSGEPSRWESELARGPRYWSGLSPGLLGSGWAQPEPRPRWVGLSNFSPGRALWRSPRTSGPTPLRAAGRHTPGAPALLRAWCYLYDVPKRPRTSCSFGLPGTKCSRNGPNSQESQNAEA